MGLDRRLELLAESRQVSEEAGHREVEEGPKLLQAILDGGPAQAHAVAGVQGLGGLRDGGGGVLDVLGLVEDDEMEGVLR